MLPKHVVPPASVVTPKLAYIGLTSKCQMRCKHCVVPEDLRKTNPVFRSRVDLNRDFKTLQKLGVESVTLSGGEPTLCFSLIEIVTAAKRHFKTVNVISNCYNPLMLKRIFGKADVWVSLDYYGEEQDHYRGAAGLWRNFTDLIEKVNVRSTLMSNNLADVKQIIAASCKFGRQVTVAPYRGDNIDLAPSPEDLKQLIHFIYVNGYEKLAVIDDCATRQYLATKTGVTRFVGCNAITGIINITPEGIVTPCPFLPYPIADIRDPHLAQKLYVARQQLLTVYPEKCQMCRYKQQCGGCKGSINAHCFIDQPVVEVN